MGTTTSGATARRHLAHRTDRTFPHPDRAPMRMQSQLPGWAPTPTVRLPGVAEALCVGAVLAKDETLRLGLPSFKALGASWAVWRALEVFHRIDGPPDLDLARSRMPEGLCLVAATDGNHGRAVARMAGLLGAAARVYVPDGVSEARVAAIRGEGAEVLHAPGVYDDAVATALAHVRSVPGGTAVLVQDITVPGHTRAPEWAIQGYSTTWWECEDELARDGVWPPDLVVVPAGAGALAASAVRHLRRDGGPRDTRLLVVEPVDAACVLGSVRAGRAVTVPGPHTSIMVGLNCGTPTLAGWEELRDGVDAHLAIGDDRAEQAVRLLAGAGVRAGETGAASLAGLAELVRGDHAELREHLGLTPTSTVLTITTEGVTDEAAWAAVVGADR